jgi:hypothetical protein
MNNNREHVSQMFVQAFQSYKSKTGADLDGNTEITQNRLANITLVFFIPFISWVTKIGKQPV